MRVGKKRAYQRVEGLVEPLPEYDLRHALVELQHGPRDRHAPGALEGHPAEDVLQLAGVGVEGGLVELHRVLHLGWEENHEEKKG